MTHSRLILAAAFLSVTAMPAMAIDPGSQAEPGAQAATASVSPLAAQPLDRLSATRDRPLFSPTRRPPAPPPVIPVAPAPPPSPPNIALLAVIMDGEEARAIVRTGPAAKTMRVQIGDDIDGWKVGQIEARQLVLLLDDRTATFNMFAGNSAPPSTGAASQPATGQPQNLVQQALVPPNASASNSKYPSKRRQRQ